MFPFLALQAKTQKDANSPSTQGYDVTIGCRDDVRAANAVRAIKLGRIPKSCRPCISPCSKHVTFLLTHFAQCREGQADAKVESIRLDLADLSSIVECYKNLSKQNKLVFDVLLNNAGVMACPKMTTKDGFEYQARSCPCKMLSVCCA
eukprot:1145963-Pelagomonas_calceolata.AAC.3